MPYTKKEIIKIFNEVHKGIYDYSLLPDRLVTRDKIKYVCPEHGVVEQMMESHKKGFGCRFCSGVGKYTYKMFLDKATKKWGDKYIIPLFEYENNAQVIEFECKKHGKFERRIGHFLDGHACPYCETNRYDVDNFITKATEVHKVKYDYSLVKFEKLTDKIDITCKDHGVFTQTCASHLMGAGCMKCGGAHQYNTEEWIEMVNKKGLNIHNYDLSKVKYVNNYTSVIFNCEKHGDFNIKPIDFVSGGVRYCPGCSPIQNWDFNRLVKEGNDIHNNKYTYYDDGEVFCEKHVRINCPIHGDFRKTPSNHMRGGGCPECSASKGEVLVAKVLRGC